MKSVLISIQPKWCALISSGRKTIEVRKTSPNIKPPFKCYIYCTKGNPKDPHQRLETHAPDSKIHLCNGKVMGEFICDRIDEYTNYSLDEQSGHIKRREELLRSACMTLKNWRDYIGNYRSDFGYCWHIADIIIYDIPKELTEFHKPIMATGLRYENDTIKRPPQSWFYVEELSE